MSALGLCARRRAASVPSFSKGSLFAVKSVLQLISASAADLPSSVATPSTRPSLAARSVSDAFTPFFRKPSIAFSMSPPQSVSIFLHSIIPWPVLDRRSFTSFAVISAISVPRTLSLSSAKKVSVVSCPLSVVKTDGGQLATDNCQQTTDDLRALACTDRLGHGLLGRGGCILGGGGLGAGLGLAATA